MIQTHVFKFVRGQHIVFAVGYKRFKCYRGVEANSVNGVAEQNKF